MLEKTNYFFTFRHAPWYDQPKLPFPRWLGGGFPGRFGPFPPPPPPFQPSTPTPTHHIWIRLYGFTFKWVFPNGGGRVGKRLGSIGLIYAIMLGFSKTPRSITIDAVATTPDPEQLYNSCSPSHRAGQTRQHCCCDNLINCRLSYYR